MCKQDVLVGFSFSEGSALCASNFNVSGAARVLHFRLKLSAWPKTIQYFQFLEQSLTVGNLIREYLAQVPCREGDTAASK